MKYLLKTKLLIISCFHNRVAEVENSVDSVVSQLTPEMHFVVVDDGSTDGTSEALDQWENRDGKNVTVIHQKNMGFVNSLIYHINNIDCEYIAIHGAGDISYEGRFSKQIVLLDFDKKLGVVSSRVNNINSYDNAKTITGSAFSGNAEKILLKQNIINHGAVCFRKDIYLKAGGYRSFFEFAQDRDLWCRMSHFCEFRVIDDILYERVSNAKNSVSGSPEKRIRQKLLSNLASFCHDMRLKGKSDPLKQYGYFSIYMLSKDKKLEREIFMLALSAIKHKKRESFSIYFDAHEKISSLSISKLLLVLLNKMLPTRYWQSGNGKIK
ncbi:glycosyltransferase family A protein [Halotalea alkalilenta]|uniref:glycosyltransferase family A protein n=1 Tax=Halotalea alkalilenta TaxID=376489 RepID=UPI0009ED8D68|nr:glycosyltransferase family A protein [Halotalea alkalilenta]